MVQGALDTYRNRMDHGLLLPVGYLCTPYAIDINLLDILDWKLEGFYKFESREFYGLLQDPFNRLWGPGLWGFENKPAATRLAQKICRSNRLFGGS